MENLSQNIKKIWSTRDELSPRNLRIKLLPVFLVLPLAIVIGDLRFLDQEIIIFGIDSNTLIMMAFGLGFLSILFVKEKHILMLLRASVIIQLLIMVIQVLTDPSIGRLIEYLVFHMVNGVSTACGFYLIAFVLNNVERLFTVLISQLYYALTYIFLPSGFGSVFLRFIIPALVIVVLLVITFSIKQPGETDAPRDVNPTASESGITVIIILYMIYYVITLMAMYIEYQEQVVSSLLYGVGGLVAVGVTIVIMLIFNYSAMHLWSLCLVCSVLGIGALYYAPVFITDTGSLFYGVGEGLGYMIIIYMMGGALKRSGSFELLKICCLFICINYVFVSGLFAILYNNLHTSTLDLAFTAVLVLLVICFLFAPILQRKLFNTDWVDGFHMADMPDYVQTLSRVEQISNTKLLELTPREMEVFTMLLTGASSKQIAFTLKISKATVNFHSNNLYRKLEIQSRTELFANYADMIPKNP